MPDLKQKIQLNGKYYIGDAAVAQLLTQNAADDQTRAMVLEMGLTSGQIVELSTLQQLQNALQALVDRQDSPDLLAPSIDLLLRNRNFHHEADVIKTAGAAIRAFPWDQIVTFAPLPERKPDGGFLEIGEFDDDTYAWENSVKLLLGSNGKVYAEVVECVTELPDLDDEGRPINGAEEDNHYFMTEQQPIRFTLRDGNEESDRAQEVLIFLSEHVEIVVPRPGQTPGVMDPDHELAVTRVELLDGDVRAMLWDQDTVQRAEEATVVTIVPAGASVTGLSEG